MGIRMIENYGMHRCYARCHRSYDKRYKGKHHFRSFKNRSYDQIYDECVNYIQKYKPMYYMFAERTANVLGIKIHLVTKVFSQLNREGILSQRSKHIDPDGCWSAAAYYVRKVPNEVDKA